jgi:hypothetical protein
MAEQTYSLRRSLAWGTIAFGVALAVVVGIRLEQAALTVVVGVACGVGASIPTSLLVVALLQKRTDKNQRQQQANQTPQVVVLAPQAIPQMRGSGASWPQEYALPVPTQRQFSVIGEEETTDL